MVESIGLSLLIVLESLTPPERLAFVLHDIFAVPFENIGQIMDRTPEAARQLASRARRRVQAAPQLDPDLPTQRRAVDAFLSAAREGTSPACYRCWHPRWCSGSIPARQRRSRSPAPRQPPAHPAYRAALAAVAIPVTVNGTPGAQYGTWTSLCACSGSLWHTARSPNSTW